MHITEIKLAAHIKRGQLTPEYFATLHRVPDSDYIAVTLHTPKGDIEHTVMADDEADVFSMAEILQECLDGRRGTNSDIHSYYCLLQHFMD